MPRETGAFFLLMHKKNPGAFTPGLHIKQIFCSYYCPKMYAKMSGATIVASLSTINLGV
jgi:hypothetical protein